MSVPRCIVGAVSVAIAVCPAVRAELVVRGAVEPAKPVIGDVITCRFTVQHDGAGVLEPIVLEYSTAAFLAVSSETWRRRSWFGRRTEDGVRFILQAVSTGTYTIAASEVRLHSAGDVRIGRAPPVLTVVVSGVELPPGVAREGNVADIAGPRSIPVWWPVVAVAAVVVLLLAGAWVLLRRARPVERATPTDRCDPQIEALQRLEQLAAGYLAAGRIKEFYLELSAVLRTYVGECTGVNAPELTTDELYRALQRRVPHEFNSALRALLAEVDLPKYARHQPGTEEMRRDLLRARDLITVLQAPRPSEAPQPVAEGQGT